MDGRHTVPVEVQSAYRRVHRSRAELEERREAEASVRVQATTVKPPKYMKDTKKRTRFRNLAKMLQEVNEQLCTTLDVDALAAYVDAQTNYEYDQQLVEEYQARRTAVDDEKWCYAELERLERIRNAAQAKADKLRSDLLLEPASRARAMMPKQEAPKVNKFAQFEDGGE